MEFTIFNQHPRLSYGLSERSDGTMKLYFDEARDGAARANRQRYFEKNGISPMQVVAADVVHGADVRAVTESDGGSFVPRTDGLLTSRPDLILSTTVADCFPLFFVDPQHMAIGIAHAGWRGISAGIVSAMVTALQREYSTLPTDLVVGIGPGLGECHFEVHADVAEQFLGTYDAFVKSEAGMLRVDLPGIVERQLVSLGVPQDHIERDGTCTYEASDRYFSFRRDHPPAVEAMVAHITWRSESL